MNANTPEDRSSRPESADIMAGHRYACALTRDAEAAETLVSEAWVDLARQAGPAAPEHEEWDGGSRRIALYRTIRARYQRQARRMGPWSSGKALFAQCDDLEVVELETVYLTTVEGLSAGEVSAFTNSPIGRIRSLLASGREKLHRSLQSNLKANCN